MAITLLYHPEDKTVANIFYVAPLRSLSSAQVCCYDYSQLNLNNLSHNSQIYCLLNPRNTECKTLHQLASHRRKVVLLGQLGTQLDTDIGLEVSCLGQEIATWGEIYPAVDKIFDVSAATVAYESSHPLIAQLSLQH